MINRLWRSMHAIRRHFLSVEEFSSASEEPVLRRSLTDRRIRLNGTIEVFQGLVQAYLAVGKYKEAMAVSKEALQLMPRNARALTLVGVVLSRKEECREKVTFLSFLL